MRPLLSVNSRHFQRQQVPRVGNVVLSACKPLQALPEAAQRAIGEDSRLDKFAGHLLDRHSIECALGSRKSSIQSRNVFPPVSCNPVTIESKRQGSWSICWWLLQFAVVHFSLANAQPGAIPFSTGHPFTNTPLPTSTTPTITPTPIPPIYGCFKTHNTDAENQGQLRIVTTPGKCDKNETPIDFQRPR